MNKLNTLEDIKGWAKEIIEGGGNKFIALSKADQYEIAKVIMAAYGEKPSECEPPSTEERTLERSEKPLEGAGLASIPGDQETMEREEAMVPPSPIGGEVPAEYLDKDPNEVVELKPMRVMEFRQKKMLPQEVYDAFIKYCETHPMEKSVMDFQTGTKSFVAAFAYWLFGDVGEELTPPKTKTRDIMNDWD